MVAKFISQKRRNSSFQNGDNLLLSGGVVIILTAKTIEELISNLKTLRGSEVRSQIEILWHLHEVRRREMDKERGFESLYEFAMMKLGYSKNEAYLRIRASRTFGRIPTLIENGSPFLIGLPMWPWRNLT